LLVVRVVGKELTTAEDERHEGGLDPTGVVRRERGMRTAKVSVA
jgi:hypothetical protein